MVVARVTCHAFPCGRQLAALTVKNKEPPSTFSPPLGFALSSIPVQPSPAGGLQDASSGSGRWPLPPPSVGLHSHHAPALSAASGTATASATSPRRRLVGTAGSPRSDRIRPSTSWCQVSSCSTTACL